MCLASSTRPVLIPPLLCRVTGLTFLGHLGPAGLGTRAALAAPGPLAHPSCRQTAGPSPPGGELAQVVPSCSPRPAARASVSSPSVEDGHSGMRDSGSNSHRQFSLWRGPKGITGNAMTKGKKQHARFLRTGPSCRRAARTPGLAPGLAPSRTPGAQDQTPAQAPGRVTPAMRPWQTAPLSLSERGGRTTKSTEETLTKRLGGTGL